MHSQLLELVDRYASLEVRVQKLMKKACASVCAACLKVCCRPDMCRETVENPFLVLVRDHATAKPAWKAGAGWLDSQGCRLKVGRPPVCYEFLCPAILQAQPDEATRHRLKELAMLLSRAGRRAIGGDHLVEIMSPERLAQVKPPRLAAHFDLAEAELIELESFWSQPPHPK